MSETAPPPLVFSMAGWQCRIIIDTWDGYTRLTRLFGDAAAEDGESFSTFITSTLTVLFGGEAHPEISWHRGGQPCSFAPIFAGPEGKRFVRVGTSGRMLYADTSVGKEAALELCGEKLHLLHRDSWPLYLFHVLTWVMLREEPLVALHAAVCAIHGAALLLVGPSGSGKSTLSYALARQGADYFSDETAFLRGSSHQLFVSPQRIGLRPGGLAALAAAPDIDAWYESKRDDLKCAPVLPTPQAGCPEDRSVLLLINGFGERPALAPVNGGEAARRLACVMGYGNPSPIARLEAAADVVCGLPCYALTIGRPEETAAMLIARVEEMTCRIR